MMDSENKRTVQEVSAILAGLDLYKWWAWQRQRCKDVYKLTERRYNKVNEFRNNLVQPLRPIADMDDYLVYLSDLYYTVRKKSTMLVVPAFKLYAQDVMLGYRDGQEGERYCNGR